MYIYAVKILQLLPSARIVLCLDHAGTNVPVLTESPFAFHAETDTEIHNNCLFDLAFTKAYEIYTRNRFDSESCLLYKVLTSSINLCIRYNVSGVQFSTRQWLQVPFPGFSETTYCRKHAAHWFS